MKSKKSNQILIKDLINWPAARALEKKLGGRLQWEDLPRIGLPPKKHMQVIRDGTLQDAIKDINRTKGPIK
jgi:hypothetical protein